MPDDKYLDGDGNGDDAGYRYSDDGGYACS